jgi:hypothetical protein
MHPLGGRTAERTGTGEPRSRKERPSTADRDRHPSPYSLSDPYLPHSHDTSPRNFAPCSDDAPLSRQSRGPNPRPPGKMTGEGWEELTTRRRNREPGASERVRHPMDTPLPGCDGAQTPALGARLTGRGGGRYRFVAPSQPPHAFAIAGIGDRRGGKEDTPIREPRPEGAHP